MISMKKTANRKKIVIVIMKPMYPKLQLIVYIYTHIYIHICMYVYVPCFAISIYIFFIYISMHNYLDEQLSICTLTRMLGTYIYTQLYKWIYICIYYILCQFLIRMLIQVSATWKKSFHILVSMIKLYSIIYIYMYVRVCTFIFICGHMDYRMYRCICTFSVKVFIYEYVQLCFQYT